MLLKRTANQVLQDALEKITKYTPITNTHPGSIARALIEAWKDEIPSLYDFAEFVLNMGFISKATGEYLDMIGQLFSYPRRTRQVVDEVTGEITEELIDDDTYRYEISQRVLAAAKGNYQAIRLAILTVPGVQDAFGKEYTHGTGSFSFYVIPEHGFNEVQIKQDVERVINDEKSFGVRPHIILPTNIPFSIGIELLFHEATAEQDKERIRFDVKQAIKKYIAELSMGSPLIYNELVQRIMEVHEKILDFNVLKFYLNHEPVLLTNQYVNEDERIVLEEVEVI